MKNKLSCILKFSIVSIMAIFFTILLNHNISYAEEEIDTSFDPSTCDVRYGKGHCGKNVNWLINSDGTLHVYYKSFKDKNKKYAHLKDGEMENFSIKDNKRPGWAKKRKHFKKLVIHSGVNTIGDFAFLDLDSEEGSIENCNSNSCKLEEIFIASNLDRIGTGAFLGCQFLSCANLSRVKNIDSAAFCNCINLTNIVLDGANRMEYIGPCAFEGTSVQYVTLPLSTKKVCENAFIIHNLRKLFIPVENYDKLETGCSYAVKSNVCVLTSYYPSKRPSRQKNSNP